MTLDEAKKVAAICQEADNGCPVCVRHLVERLNEIIPEFVWEFDEYPTIIKVFPRET